MQLALWLPRWVCGHVVARRSVLLSINRSLLHLHRSLLVARRSVLLLKQSTFCPRKALMCCRQRVLCFLSLEPPLALSTGLPYPPRTSVCGMFQTASTHAASCLPDVFLALLNWTTTWTVTIRMTRHLICFLVCSTCSQVPTLQLMYEHCSNDDHAHDWVGDVSCV